MCHIVHMKTISIRDLHLQTGRWVRRSGQGNPLVVTDRGRPVATLIPYEEGSPRKGLPDREAQIRKLPRLPVDSTDYVSEGRDRP